LADGALQQIRRSIAMLSPGARDAIDREQAMRLLAELAQVQGRLDRLNGRLRERVPTGGQGRDGKT
jgi:hypothetical protein